MSVVAAHLARIRERLAAAAARAGRDVAEIELIAVSKTHGEAKIRDAIAAGQTLFGESRLQEARPKIAILPERARWHFIGHLQKNKIRQALPLFELFHGIDSLALASDLNRIADEEGLRPRILLEINVAGEGTKFGFSPAALRRDLDSLLALDRVEIQGLMALPPFSDDPEHSRRYFIQLRDLRDALARESALPLAHLSMGMSHDFEVAIEEGATFIRVGTAIFGERDPAPRPADDFQPS